MILGGIYGMLFTKIAGSDLRKKLKKSKSPLRDLFIAGAEMDLNFMKWTIEMIRKKFKI